MSFPCGLMLAILSSAFNTLNHENFCDESFKANSGVTGTALTALVSDSISRFR